ncbi:MAG: metallophosphoesterase [Kiritimatiellae bacterium]|nr:metallophosphoesterase [Kiritimatiellia bacterium]
MNRREFLKGAAALGFAAGGPVLRLAAAYAPGRKANMTFGVLSDIHFKIAPDGKGLRPSHDASAFVHALEWFRDQGVDAVMVAGDLADTGLVKELEAVAAAWQKAFPNDKAPDGRRVERVFITGNHDWDAYTYDGGVFVKKLYPDEAERSANLLCKDLKGCWERIMQEPYVPVYRKVVKGYSFVGAHWQNEPCHPKCETAFRHVGEWFAANGAKLDPSRPFFYCQHAHLQNTVYGPWAWGHDSGETTAALVKFPNAVAFSGHSHYSLTDDRSIWQGGFTSLGTASLRACATPADELHPDSGYENAWGGLNAYKAMRPLAETSRQGMLVRVFDDCIAFTRRDFSSDKMLGGDWVVPLPARKAQPFAFDVRRAKEKAPAFAAGATLAVSKTEATNRGGRAKINGVKKNVPQEKKASVRLDFPQADAVRSTRTFFYEATFAADGGKTAVKRILATNVFKPDDAYWTSNGESMTVCLDQLPPAPFKVEVRAVSALGSRSDPLCGSFPPA